MAGVGCDLFLAPMAGVTNTIFRRICRGMGADVVTSEFVSADGVRYRNERTLRYVEFDDSERPIGIQLFGAVPERLAEAARELIDWLAPDFIDLNFGCPVNKVVCKNGGSSLLRDCPLLQRVALAVVRAAGRVPVTAKIRIGWDARTINAVQTARLLEDAGVVRVAVHGRTREQGYSGEANWDVIGEVVSSVSVPVVGNGDIRTGGDAVRRVRETGVKGVMVGRAAMGNPWIFSEIRAAFEGRPWQSPSLEERWRLIVGHCKEEVAWRGNEGCAMRSLRARLMAYTKGMSNGVRLRERLAGVASLAELEDIAGWSLREFERGEGKEAGDSRLVMEGVGIGGELVAI